MAFGKKMSLSRVENPCFLLFLVIFQAVFILILYRGSSSNAYRNSFPLPQPFDYSKKEDVYKNLSLFTRAPDNANLRYCTESSIFVGPLAIRFDTLPSEETIISKNPYVQPGGRYRPPHCVARYKTAVIVPHKNHEKHLKHFLYYLHPFLQRQQLNYCIYLINQAGSGPFNRAKLLNVGVREAMKDDDWDCLLLHDVDLIPENDYNLYVCDDYFPKQMSTAIDKLHYSFPYWSFFGGVIALTPEHYMKINGFPNTFWDKDGEDDDIAERIAIAGMGIDRVPLYIGHYRMIDYGQAAQRAENFRRPAELNTKKTWRDDGMNSLEYKLLGKKYHHLYLNITVDIGTAPVLPPEGENKGNEA